MMAYITSVCPEEQIAQLNTGERIPITQMFDAEAVEVADPAFCRRGVAGPDAEGRWYPFSCDAEEGE